VIRSNAGKLEVHFRVRMRSSTPAEVADVPEHGALKPAIALIRPGRNAMNPGHFGDGRGPSFGSVYSP